MSIPVFGSDITNQRVLLKTLFKIYIFIQNSQLLLHPWRHEWDACWLPGPELSIGTHGLRRIVTPSPPPPLSELSQARWAFWAKSLTTLRFPASFAYIWLSVSKAIAEWSGRQRWNKCPFLSVSSVPLHCLVLFFLLRLVSESGPPSQLLQNGKRRQVCWPSDTSYILDELLTVSGVAFLEICFVSGHSILQTSVSIHIQISKHPLMYPLRE